MSDGIRRKLFFHGKVFYCGRCQSKHTFPEGYSSEQVDGEQQPPTEQNERRVQQDLPEVTPEIHQDEENPSKKSKVKQSDVALGQPITQEGDAEATSRQK